MKKKDTYMLLAFFLVLISIINISIFGINNYDANIIVIILSPIIVNLILGFPFVYVLIYGLDEEQIKEDDPEDIAEKTEEVSYLVIMIYVLIINLVYLILHSLPTSLDKSNEFNMDFIFHYTVIAAMIVTPLTMFVIGIIDKILNMGLKKIDKENS